MHTKNHNEVICRAVAALRRRDQYDVVLVRAYGIMLGFPMLRTVGIRYKLISLSRFAQANKRPRGRQRGWRHTAAASRALCVG